MFVVKVTEMKLRINSLFPSSGISSFTGISLSALSLCLFIATSNSDASEMNNSYYETSLRVIGGFEAGIPNSWGKVAPNIGGNTLSCGMLQWSFSDNALQPLVKKAGRRTILKYMPTFGARFWQACTSRQRSDAQSIILGWQSEAEVSRGQGSNSHVASQWRPEYRGVVNELSTLFSSQEMMNIQGDFAKRVGQSAWRDAERWAHDSRGSQATPDISEFAVFFNLRVMARGAALPNYGDVKRLKRDKLFQSPGGMEPVFDWLLSSASPMRQPTEAHRNSEAWRQSLPADQHDLFLLAYLSAKRLNRDDGTFQAVDLNRSGALITGSGWVNGAKTVFNSNFLPDGSLLSISGHSPISEIPRAKYPMPEDFFQKALAITGQFETSHSLKSGESWGAVADDFDGGGISCGLLQWNIKSVTLQPLVVSAGKEIVLRLMPTYGEAFWSACTTTNGREARETVLSWQTKSQRTSGSDGGGGALQPDVLSELQSLFRSDSMRRIQIDSARSRALAAWDYAVNWARDQRGENEKPTPREFAVFFDTYVHLGGMRTLGENGSKKTLGYADVLAFKSDRKGKDCIDEICDWLRNVSPPMLQSDEAHYNSDVFRKRLAPNETDLFILCYLRAMKATSAGGRVKALALCRRGTILFDEGKVNQTLFHFSRILERRVAQNSP